MVMIGKHVNPSYNRDYRGIKDLLFDKIVHDIIWRNIEFKFR
jgi:hypothetical protein